MALAVSLRRARGRRSDRGAVAVEMALVMPVLLLVVAAIIDFGRAFMAQQTLTAAAREGARYNAVRSADSLTLQRARDNAGLGGNLGSGTITVTIATSCGANPMPDTNLVRVSAPFRYLILHLFVPTINDGTFTAQGSMRCAG